MESTSVSANTKVIKKRKYSRGGCKECKRRKIKCDEAKPNCHTCARLNKYCVYPSSVSSSTQKISFEDPQIVLVEGGNQRISNGRNRSTQSGSNVQSPNLHRDWSNLLVDSPSHREPHPNSLLPHPLKLYQVNHSHMRSPISSRSLTHDTTSLSNVDVDLDRTTRLNSHLPQQPHVMHPQHTETEPSSHERKGYKISDILSPDIDFLNDYNWGSIAPDEVRNLFGDANVLVHDSLEIFGFEQFKHFTDLDDDDGFNRGDDFNYSNSVHGSEELSSIPDFPMKELSHKSESQPILDSSHKSNKELIESTFDDVDFAGPHEVYLNKLTDTELGYHLFPFAHGIGANAVLKILLKYSQGCSYLLTALLSSSATFQFIQSRKPVHEQNRSKYTSICLKLLSDAFPKPNEKSSSMANDIEKLLLTILILTSCFTATAYFQQESAPNSTIMLSWKTHLRGVKDLLLKYTELTKSSSRAYISDGLALAKSWFFSIEALAELNDPLGGTLHYSKENISQVVDIIATDAEHDHSELSRIWLQTGYFSRDRNAEYHDALLKINLLTAQYPNLVQFNLFNGYSINVVRIIDEVTKCLDLLRAHNNVQVSGFRVAKVVSLIAQGRDCSVVPMVNKTTFEIPIESIGHPNYPKLERISFPASCYARETLPDGKVVCYSWFDWSEQMHIESLALKIYITQGILKLPKSHPIIKELKIRIIDSMFFIKRKSGDSSGYANDVYLASEKYYVSKTLFDERALMAQSTFRQCLQVQLNDDDLEKLTLYFKALAKLGNGSALIALEMINKSSLRSKRTAGVDENNESRGERLEIVDSPDDDQTNMEFIPYS
ncbi:hypothetical protein KGF57_003420 [Candida theae]|uniref:Zn(2)-C6 fungal-type domain-containing protein n=1 Tax=Candida theae TaxID=1198502 RepID=A0AAD5BDX1_9ASCO|nr:uncharacterized protein KGF57_003420 [Candida theae]KAI5956679.1 hypothetical protein KGF57_003420 [Candida theae]